jgi:hypothetical protein
LKSASKGSLQTSQIRHAVEECSDPYLDAETISLASILVTRWIELEVGYSIREGPSIRKNVMSYIVLPALALLFEQTCSDRCDAGIVQQVTGKVFEEIY